MSIIYNEKTREFHLYNQEISYIIKILDNDQPGQPKGAFEARMMCSTWRKSCISPAIPSPSICACWRNTGSSSRNGRRYR